MSHSPFWSYSLNERGEALQQHGSSQHDSPMSLFPMNQTPCFCRASRHTVNLPKCRKKWSKTCAVLGKRPANLLHASKYLETGNCRKGMLDTQRSSQNATRACSALLFVWRCTLRPPPKKNKNDGYMTLLVCLHTYTYAWRGIARVPQKIRCPDYASYFVHPKFEK